MRQAGAFQQLHPNNAQFHQTQSQLKRQALPPPKNMPGKKRKTNGGQNNSAPKGGQREEARLENLPEENEFVGEIEAEDLPFGSKDPNYELEQDPDDEEGMRVAQRASRSCVRMRKQNGPVSTAVLLPPARKSNGGSVMGSNGLVMRQGEWWRIVSDRTS
jgi:hypothetical protein